MGTFVKIELKTKTESNIKRKNNALKQLGVESRFMSEQDFQDWADDAKDNPDNLNVAELKEKFNWVAEVGVVMFDVAFNRTSQEDAEKYAEFIFKNKRSIKSIHNADELTSRYPLSMEHVRAIIDLKEKETEPEKLPESEKTKTNLQSGLLLCKSFSPNPFWVVFGNVEKPTFLKEKIFADDIYNNIYRDNKGLAYLMIPLMPLNNKQVEFAYEVFDRAWSMGLREDPNYFLPMVYGMDITNLNSVVDSFKQTYTQDELIERFETTLKSTLHMFPYNETNGIVWYEYKKRFKPCGTNNPSTLMTSKVSILNALVMSINNKEAVADIMSNTLNKIFKEFEFVE